MDRRLMDRRRRVAEERARSNLGRLVRLLVWLALVAGLVWFAQSPFLSVAEVAVRGTNRVDPVPVLEAHRVVEGRPLLLLDVAGAEQSLLEDPWVEAASVARDWPTRVIVDIEERDPAAVAELADGRWLISEDAVLLERAGADEGAQLPVVALSGQSAGEAAESLELEGAVEYLTSLPGEYRAGAVVRRGGEGLEATVAGYLVRVGPPFDTEEKATVTAAMLDSGVEEGSILTVVAPASPAVLPPGATIPEADPEVEPTSTTMP